jgi:hypothetical protein
MSGPVRLTVSGDWLTGYSATILMVQGSVQLNPEHSRWLMGYPEEWARSAPGYADWLKWQDLMQQASSEPSDTASEQSGDMATQ